MDEWFIVYMLFKFSQCRTDIVVQCRDNDGEFLLIEAANVIPSWLSPEVSANRVFVYDGRVHIVSLPRNPSELALVQHSNVSVRRAIKLIADERVNTIASMEVQQCILDKLGVFPDEAHISNKHYVRCVVPASVLCVLQQYPSVVSAATRTFYRRDYLDMRNGRKMRRFLNNTDDDWGRLVPCRVRFTRCLYAQLKNQKFSAPSCFGLSATQDAHINDPMCRARLMGAKLSCAMEMLYQHGIRARARFDDGDGVQAANREQRWELFFASLQKRGYFNGVMQGSEQYTDLLSEARAKFDNDTVLPPSPLREDDVPSSSVAAAAVQWSRRIDHILDNHSPQSVLDSVLSFDELAADDDEAWMCISVEELDEKLRKLKGNDDGGRVDMDIDDDVDLNVIADTMKEFIETVSGLEGVDDNNVDDDVEFDMKKFVHHLQTNHTVNEVTGGEDADPHDGVSSLVHQVGVNALRPDQLEMYSLMNRMDGELSSSGGATRLSSSSRTKPHAEHDGGDHDSNTVNGGVEPVDLNLNLVSNLLSSFQSQQGQAGPVSNIMSSLGVSLPIDTTTTTTDEI